MANLTQAIDHARRIAGDSDSPDARLVLLRAGVASARVPAILVDVRREIATAADRAEAEQDYGWVAVYQRERSAAQYLDLVMSAGTLGRYDPAAASDQHEAQARRRQRSDCRHAVSSRHGSLPDYDPIDIETVARHCDLMRVPSRRAEALASLELAITLRQPDEFGRESRRRSLARLAHRYAGSLATMLRVPDTRGIVADVLAAVRG